MKKQLMILAAGGLSLAAVQGFSAEEDDAAYREGYGLILEQNWAQAQTYFSDFKTQWTESVWSDDAAFWQCYAIEQMTSDDQAHFTCYEDFIKAYPESSWVSDARSKLFVTGSRLADRGQPGYMERVMALSTSAADRGPDSDYDFDFDFDIDDRAIGESVAVALDRARRELERLRDRNELIVMPPMPRLPELDGVDDPAQIREFQDRIERSMRDYQVRMRDYRERNQRAGSNRSSVDDELLTILAALRNDERASEILLQRLDSSDDPALRSRIVLLLENVRGPNITERLIEIARNDASTEVRENAVIVLLDQGDDISRDFLVSVVRDPAYSLPVRAGIIAKVEDWDEATALAVLEDILNRESEPALIEEAADALADMKTAAATTLLISSYEAQTSPELKRIMLDEMARIESPQVMNILSSTALESDDEALAVVAIEGIADREDNIAVAALEHIYLNADKSLLRLAAINGIGAAESERAVEVLLQVLADTDNDEIRIATVRALGDSEREAAVAGILGAYRTSTNDSVKRQALRALRQLDEFPAATDAMLEILEERLRETENQP